MTSNSDTILLKLIDGSMIIGTRKIEFHQTGVITLVNPYRIVDKPDKSISLYKLEFNQISIPNSSILYIVDIIPEHFSKLYQEKLKQMEE